jgi:uncharacterized protein
MNLKGKPLVGIIAVAIIALIAVLIFFISRSTTEQSPTMTSTSPNEPQFKKQGELSFLRQKSYEVITTIAIELADTDEKRMQGLMFRTSMADSAGMLFIFPQESPQEFWMKNTIISLDIIYVDAGKQIVSIQKYAEPYSERTLPSYKPAQYVVEVNAGFCDRHRIGEGNFVRF